MKKIMFNDRTDVDDEIARVEGILGRSEPQHRQGNMFDYQNE